LKWLNKEFDTTPARHRQAAPVPFCLQFDLQCSTFNLRPSMFDLQPSTFKWRLNIEGFWISWKLWISCCQALTTTRKANAKWDCFACFCALAVRISLDLNHIFDICKLILLVPSDVSLSPRGFCGPWFCWKVIKHLVSNLTRWDM
jgi:hypothetical protein